MHRTQLRAAGSAFALLVASGGTFAALVAARPHPALVGALRNGDDLAFVVAWLLAGLCALWLTLTTLACLVALLRGRPGVAARIASFGPPIARRLLQTAFVGTFAMLPTAAYATPSAPLVVHVGPAGRLTAVPGASPQDDAPVVRAPPSSITSTTSTTTTTLPRAEQPAAPAPLVTAPASTTPPIPAAAPHSMVVRAGDNLWRIARAETARATGVAHPETRTVAGYWERVIAANRTTLRSGNPSLIFPGEVVALPPF